MDSQIKHDFVAIDYFNLGDQVSIVPPILLAVKHFAFLKRLEQLRKILVLCLSCFFIR